MRTATAWATVTNVTKTVKRIWPYVLEYWFDAVLVAGIGISIAVAVSSQHTKNGPDGPLWSDVILSIAYVVPFFFRRRYPFGSLVAVGVIISTASFIDTGLINAEFVAFMLTGLPPAPVEHQRIRQANRAGLATPLVPAGS